jgi:hypothetical protein
MAVLASCPTTRKRVAAVYTAAAAGPLRTVTRTMSSRCRASAARLLIARGQVNDQNSRHGGGPSSAGRPGAACRRPRRSSHHQAATADPAQGSAQAPASSAPEPPSTATATSPSCSSGRPTRSSATVGSMVAYPRVAARSVSDSVVTGSRTARSRTARRVWSPSPPTSRAKDGAQPTSTTAMSSESTTTGVRATRWKARMRSGRPSERSRAMK